ncbi:MAG: hypothetical protein R2755_19980 [Acidimicrobiales bacterium]
MGTAIAQAYAAAGATVVGVDVDEAAGRRVMDGIGAPSSFLRATCRPWPSARAWSRPSWRATVASTWWSTTPG